MIQETLNLCMNEEEVESMEFVRDELFPLVKSLNVQEIQREIPEWELQMEEYIDDLLSLHEKYAYSRKNAWRKHVPDGSLYHLNPRHYSSEEEYLKQLDEVKYGWRRAYSNKDTLGIDVNDYETSEEFSAAYKAKLAERRRESTAFVNDPSDDTVYTICSVVFDANSKSYAYKTNGIPVQVNDQVRVLVGKYEKTAVVVSVSECTPSSAPYPINKMKSILGKVE